MCWLIIYIYVFLYVRFYFGKILVFGFSSKVFIFRFKDNVLNFFNRVLVNLVGNLIFLCSYKIFCFIRS